MAAAGEDGDWIFVRYGRKGRARQRWQDPRPQDQAWSSGDRGGKGARGMDRAFPAPRWRGQGQTTAPNPNPTNNKPSIGRERK